MTADRLGALEALRHFRIDPYPARCTRTHLLSDLFPEPSRNSPDLAPSVVSLAGRLLAVTADSLAFEDPSGRRWFSRAVMPSRGGGEITPSATDGETTHAQGEGEAPEGGQADAGPFHGTDQPVLLPVAVAWPLLDPGDVVQLALEAGSSGEWVLTAVGMLARSVRDPAPRDARGEPVPGGGATASTLIRRAQLLQELRAWFVEQGFLEVETPILALQPGLEPHLDPFASAYRSSPGEPGFPVYLLTSPEYAMKRLVAAGLEKVFQLSRVFRNGETGAFHNPEFTMLEWYRAFASYVEIQDDLERLICALAIRLGLGRELIWQGRRVDLTPPWPRLTVRDAFRKYAGIELSEAMDAASLRVAAGRVGIILSPGETWEECYFRLLVERIEPQLGLERPVFLTDYPAAFAALSRVRGGAFPVAERFELYLAGVEVGNAYSELNDPAAQRARFEEERVQRATLGLSVFEADEEYLAMLERGLPPTGGIAVGVDRLVMLLLDLPDVRRSLAFPFPMTGG